MPCGRHRTPLAEHARSLHQECADVELDMSFPMYVVSLQNVLQLSFCCRKQDFSSCPSDLRNQHLSWSEHRKKSPKIMIALSFRAPYLNSWWLVGEGLPVLNKSFVGSLGSYTNRGAWQGSGPMSTYFAMDFLRRWTSWGSKQCSYRTSGSARTILIQRVNSWRSSKLPWWTFSMARLKQNPHFGLRFYLSLRDGGLILQWLISLEAT